MILYDQNYKILAISRNSLELLGYSDSDLFFQKHSDISDMFLYQIYSYDEQKHFIDYIIKHPEYNLQSIKLKLDDGNIISIHIDIDIMFFKNDNFCYQVKLNKNAGDKDYKIPIKPELRIPKLFEDVIAKKPAQTIDASNDIRLTKEWLFRIPNFIGMTRNTFLVRVSEFIKICKEKYEELSEAALLDDINHIKEISAEIRDRACELKFDPFLAILIKLQTISDPKEVAIFLNLYMDFINKIENILKKELK